MDDSEYKEAEKAALQLIARAEQTVCGLRRKLEKRGHKANCTDKVIFHLLETNLLNDRRYAGLWLTSRLRLPRSPRRLLVSLCNKGIDHNDAQAALKTVLNEETEQALLIRFVKKYGKKCIDNSSLKHLLKNEGFSSLAVEIYFDAEKLTLPP